MNDTKFALKLNNEFLHLTTLKKKLVPHAIETLDYLHEKYKLHILSNCFEEVQHKKMENSNLLKYFDKIILSDNIGVNKPNPILFEYALKQIDCDRENVCMIGDSWEADIVGARNSHIDQIWLKPKDEKEYEIKATYTINSLNEIISIL